jgi:hypothetical protein
VLVLSVISGGCRLATFDDPQILKFGLVNFFSVSMTFVHSPFVLIYLSMLNPPTRPITPTLLSRTGEEHPPQHCFSPQDKSICACIYPFCFFLIQTGSHTPSGTIIPTPYIHSIHDQRAYKLISASHQTSTSLQHLPRRRLLPLLRLIIFLEEL